MTGIYKITNPKGKIYIGQSINISIRKKTYERYNFSNQTLLYNSVKKYGWDNHKFEVIEECDVDKLDERETYWKFYFDSVENGLNCSYWDNTPMRGRKHSNEAKKKIGLSRKGKTHTEETKRKMSKNSGQRGVPRTEYQKNQIRKANKGKIHTYETRKKQSIPILQYDSNGNFIREWIGLSEIKNELGILFSLSKSKKIMLSNGYIWTYKTENYPLKIDPVYNRLSIPILQYDLSGDFIKEWPSIKEASKYYKSYSIQGCLLGNHKTACGYIWKYKTENYPMNIEVNIKRKKHNNENLRKTLNKPIIQLDLEGNEINYFESMNEAEKKTKISAYNISGCMRGKQKTAGGFIWIFKDR
jgi:group I intron endonuclease